MVGGLGGDRVDQVLLDLARRRYGSAMPRAMLRPCRAL
jgi:hypothetical protein